MTVTLRYFAAVAEAAGTADEVIELPHGASVGDLKAALASAHGEDFARQLAISAVLLDGRRADDAEAIPQGQARVDVLPPFAGG
ncbi:MAG: MoaD/ThiS family protein [Actinomycetaceae bacterium]|nr:MoaD/ThiS family protein [Actinomycetaceae bacterium]